MLVATAICAMAVVAFGGAAQDVITAWRVKSAALSWDWESHKARLCPNQRPNVDLGEALFRAARRELGMHASKSRWPSSAGVADRFFSFSSGGFALAARDGTRRAAVYVRIWKCANDSIRAWAHATFAPAAGDPTRSDVFYAEDTVDVPSLVKRAEDAGNGSVVAVTILRDPVEHFLSGWNEIAERESRRGGGGVRRMVQGDPEAHFMQFVSDLVAGVPRFPGQERVRSLPHVFAMSGVLVPLHALGVPLVYPLATPSLHDAARKFPALASEAAPGTVPPEAMHDAHAVDAHSRTHPSGHDDLGTHEAARAVVARAGPTARAVCALSAMDYACFSDAFPVPALCLQVLDQSDFLNLPPSKTP